MRILTNPGANLPAELIREYGIVLTGSSIVVDGESHDVRDDVALDKVDGWVATANEHPFVLGTSAADFARHCLDIGEEDDEILIVMSSRKIIPSYDSARSAARTLETHPVGRKLRIRVVDSESTDLGLGLPVLAAGEAARAGFGLEDAAELVEALASRGRFAFVPRSLDNLIRGGRASFLRGWMAKMLGLRPLLAFVEGEPQMVGKCSVKDDHPLVLTEWLAAQLEGGRAWIGVSHGGVPDEAERAADDLRNRFEGTYVLVRPLTPTVYLHAGPRAIGAVVFPLDGLPWIPPAPTLARRL
jgi:DegV family protein with EDD domain